MDFDLSHTWHEACLERPFKISIHPYGIFHADFQFTWSDKEHRGYPICANLVMAAYDLMERELKLSNAALPLLFHLDVKRSSVAGGYLVFYENPFFSKAKLN